ncbi:MAG: hypothetical protein A3C55_00215 [Gammaproteobacteria bacterium RIFCSPHIGHO2_02_FULL_42_13]|nr:MAG: hypothetical protein A3C55_00215 [Gammaproteobacteria bacterium RIFCSPHIGHO2_02_FULL_42_13]
MPKIKTKDIELQPMGDVADAAPITLDSAVLQATLAEMQARIAAEMNATFARLAAPPPSY